MSELIFHSDLVQGSPAWKEHRAKFLNASDAPAMLGAAPNRTRLQLLTQFQTGVGVEHSDYVEERVFAPGHEAEALCRPLAEEVMGTELAPQVATRGRLGASFDGVTMLGDEWWEHKLLNAELRACMVPGATGRDLPLCYRIQLEQEAMVLGAERGLFSASEWTPDGKLLEHRHVWYESDPELAARIAAGWDQFLVDVANHVPVVEPVKPAPAAIKALPALLVQVRGEVVSSNLEPYRLAAEEFLAGIKTELATDQDFEDAAAAVKFCQAAEDRLARLMEEVFAQASSIDEARRSVEDISAMFRSKRLTLDKLVDTRKKSLRADIITEHQGLLDAHVKALNEANRRGWITRQTADFGEAIKGKRTLTSMREAAGVLLMQRKLALGELQNRMLENWAALTDAEGTDWAFLFADFATLGQKPKEDFQALASARVQAHKDAEAEKKRKEEERQRLEAERVAAAEQARQADAAALAATAPPAPSPAPAAQPEPPPAPPPVELSASMRAPSQLPPAAPAVPTLNLGTVCRRIGITMTADFVTTVLRVPRAPAPGSAVMFYEAQYPLICEALAAHALKAINAAR